MKKVYYTVVDNKAEMYSEPFLEIKDGTAIRADQDIVINNKDYPFAKHPKDFSLHRLGEWDGTTGVMTGQDKPNKIIDMETLGE